MNRVIVAVVASISIVITRKIKQLYPQRFVKRQYQIMTSPPPPNQPSPPKGHRGRLMSRGTSREDPVSCVTHPPPAAEDAAVDPGQPAEKVPGAPLGLIVVPSAEVDYLLIAPTAIRAPIVPVPAQERWWQFRTNRYPVPPQLRKSGHVPEQSRFPHRGQLCP